jgi:cytochrome c-type biogenesis protein CcmH
MTATIRIRHAVAGAALAALLGLGAAQAATPPPPPDADRLHALTAELRCLVCQNESLADSTAPLALDLKREIGARMAAGDSDAQIITFLVERYGDFVTYRPPWSARTLLLWLGPLGLLGLGGAVLWRHLRAATPPEEHA